MWKIAQKQLEWNFFNPFTQPFVQMNVKWKSRNDFAVCRKASTIKLVELQQQKIFQIFSSGCLEMEWDLKTAIERLSKFTVARVLFLQSLLTCFQITILNPIHSWVGLIHESFENSFVLDCLGWENNLDEILWRNPV